VEVVVSDDEGFLDLVNRIRRVEGVRSTESFVYLRIEKQTYAWGAR
jgi:Lrp/AsnC family transcriptional regulator for asnA, asnC and gidA